VFLKLADVWLLIQLQRTHAATLVDCWRGLAWPREQSAQVSPALPTAPLGMMMLGSR
jgi:hypothetical protein